MSSMHMDTRARASASTSLGSVFLAVALVVMGGCGSRTKVSSGAPVAGAAVSTGAGVVVDPDHDDHITEKYGHAAPAADRRDVIALTKRYYAAAVAGDGAQACSMMLGSLARSVPASYGGPGGSPELRGTSCVAVLSKLFRREHSVLVAEAPSLRVTKVRLHGNGGLALLSFKTTPEPREISVSLEGSAWKMASLLDASLP
jgi:hypothetical protein